MSETKKRSSLATRVMTAVPLVLLLAAAVAFGGWVMASIALVCIAMAVYEELNALRKKNCEQEKTIKRLTEENEILAEATAFFAANRRKSGKTKE